MEPYSGSPVVSAIFRTATPEEIQQAKGGWLYRFSTTIPRGLWNLVNKTCVTFNMWHNAFDLRCLETTYMQKIYDTISWWNGHRESAFIHTYDSLIGSIYVIEKESEVFKAFFKHHRVHGIFETSNSMSKIYQILQATFPEDNFSRDDFILTCNSVNTKKYRTLLFHSALKQSSLDAFAGTMQETIKKTVHNWYQDQNKKGIEINTATHLYASDIFMQLMFGESFASKELSNAMGFINRYIIKSILGTPSAEENDAYVAMLKTLREIIEITLERDLPLFKSGELNLLQKKAMIFALFFAGQETTAALLSYILWQLAINEEKQEKIFDSLSNPYDLKAYGQSHCIQNIFTQCIREFPPAHGVGRQLKEDVCLEYQLEGEEVTRKRVFFKGDRLNVSIMKFCNHLSLDDDSSYDGAFVFGKGPHECPGKKLALLEITQMVHYIVTNYKISCSQQKIDSNALVTLSLVEPIYIKFERREYGSTFL